MVWCSSSLEQVKLSLAVVLSHHCLGDLCGKRSILHPLSLDLWSLACSPQLMPPMPDGRTYKATTAEDRGTACPGHGSSAQSSALLESLVVSTLVPTPETMAGRTAMGCTASVSQPSVSPICIHSTLRKLLPRPSCFELYFLPRKVCVTSHSAFLPFSSRT